MLHCYVLNETTQTSKDGFDRLKYVHTSLSSSLVFLILNETFQFGTSMQLSVDAFDMRARVFTHLYIGTRIFQDNVRMKGVNGTGDVIFFD
jgi:hypothetical protein